jgi:hypothetical protein
MKTIKRFIAILLCISLCMSLTQAQPAPDKRQDAQTTNTIAQDVLIIIQQEQVRFTAQKSVEEMRLQIFDQAGQLVYDSGAVTGPELTWVLRQSNGEAVRSGLYAYTLSVKEAGAADAQARRGHFIVDRAKERDGKTDRLWITSQNEGGVGTELTVARNEGETIAGTSATSESKSVKAEDETARDDEAESKSESRAEVTALSSGTAGRIAKFTSSTNLGNSVMTELSGNIGIGTTNPISKLHVSSGGNAPPRLESLGGASYAAGWDFYHGTTGKGYVGAPGTGVSLAPGEMIVYGAVGTPASIWGGGVRGITVTTTGNVGIGTAFPVAKLDVDGATRTSVLQITGGADFAENFEVSSEQTDDDEITARVEAGMVVSIDPANPGRLTLSAKAYDRRVAGVISGAGGVKPGMVMSQEGTLADGKHPVALSGRVYCWVDASQGAIEPGDLLTTSSTPGHAMKATDAAKAQGAIIGKAMTGLKEGKGLVLALVTLQ